MIFIFLFIFSLSIPSNQTKAKVSFPIIKNKFRKLHVLVGCVRYENNHNTQFILFATARTVGHLSKSAEVMKLVSSLMKAPEVVITMQEFSKEMTKVGVIEEMVNAVVDSTLDSEDIEEETEEEIEKVLTAIAGETASQLPDAVRKGRIKQPASSQKAERQLEAIAEGVDDEGELEEIRARLDKVRS